MIKQARLYPELQNLRATWLGELVVADAFEVIIFYAVSCAISIEIELHHKLLVAFLLNLPSPERFIINLSSVLVFSLTYHE